MKIITHEDIINANINPIEYYYWVSDLFKNKSEVNLPVKTSINLWPGMAFTTMPCVIGNSVAGVKIITRYPTRIPTMDSKIFLFNPLDGSWISLMDGNAITVYRTGAVAAYSINKFAKKDFKNIGIIGLGNTARATMLVLNELYKDKKFNVLVYKYKSQEEDFIKRFDGYENFEFKCCDTVEEIISNSDVLISAVTFLDQDICKDSNVFPEGITIVPIHTKGFSNCDLFFDRIFGDDTSHISKFKYFNKFKNFAEYYDVENGKAEGRKNDKERIITYSVGLAMHDIKCAYNIFNCLSKEKIINNIDFKEPIQKFWV